MPPMPPRLEIEKVPPCIWSGLSLPSRASLASSPISFAISTTPFLSASRITGTTRPLRRVGGEADVVVLLEDQVVAVERGVELGELLQRRDRRLDHEREHADLDAALLVLLVQLHAEGFEVGDVGVVVVGDVRDHHPVAVQVRAGDLLDPRQRLRSIGPNLAKSTFGHGRRSMPPTPPPAPRAPARPSLRRRRPWRTPRRPP